MDCASDEKRCKIQLVKAVAQRHDYRPAIGAATTTLDATIKAYGINERVHPGMSVFNVHGRSDASRCCRPNTLSHCHNLHSSRVAGMHQPPSNLGLA
jgi:hypothetical protein